MEKKLVQRKADSIEKRATFKAKKSKSIFARSKAEV